MINLLDNPVYSLTPLAAALIGLVLLVVVITRSRETPGKWLFAGVLVAMVLHTLLIFGMRNSLEIEQALIFARIATIPCFVMFALFYHFILTFTKTEGQKYVPISAYIIVILLAALIPTDLMIKNLRVESYGYAPVQGIVTYIISPLTFVFLGGTAYNLVRKYRQSLSHNERNRLLYLLVAIVFPLGGALLDTFSNLPPAYVWGNLIFCLLTTVAILRYQLLDIRIAMRRGLVYIIMGVIVGIPYVGILYLLYFLIAPAVEKWWVHSLIIFVLAIILHPIYSRAQDWVNRLFYRDSYDYLLALGQFTREVHSIKNLRELGTGLTDMIRGALRASSICLLLPSEEQQGFIAVSCGGLEIPVSGVMLNINSPLVQWLDTYGEIVDSRQFDIIPKLQSLSLRDRNNLKRMKADLSVPLKTRQGELSGILILGPKLSRQYYSDAEKQLLTTLSSHMAMTLENAYLYNLEKSTRAELEKQNEQKTEFLHSVAHELKTPLTAILSSSELLSTQLSQINREQIEKLSGNIHRSASLMERRVSELLEHAGKSAGTINLQLEPLDAISMCEDIASQFSILFQERSQSFELTALDSIPTILADREKLEGVLVNLLSNASKYSPIGGHITMRVKTPDGKLVIEVEDTARLIPDEEKQKLFQPYYRGEYDIETSKIPGLGLGLSISKTLVELHKGEIWIESNHGTGNVFCIALPVNNT
jgi:signal transduction histidine kinase